MGAALPAASPLLLLLLLLCILVAPPAAPPASASSSSVVRKFLYDATLVSVSARSCSASVESFALAAVLSLISLVLSMSSCCPPTVADVVLRSFALHRLFGFL